jgi:glycosyl transferase, family 25
VDIPVFVVNLPRSHERRQTISARLYGIGVAFQIVDAVDGSLIPDDELAGYYDWVPLKAGIQSRYLQRSEIGCALSHLKLLQKMVAENIECACILEDDATGFEEELPQFLVQENLRHISWDLLFLGHHRSDCSRKEAWSVKKRRLEIGQYRIGEPVEVPQGSYGYLIKLDAARKLLAHAFPIRMPYDLFIGNSTFAGLHPQLITPPCVEHDYTKQTTMDFPNVKFLYAVYPWGRQYARKIFHWMPFLKTLCLKIFFVKQIPLIVFKTASAYKSVYSRFL